ncbi:hypothetical protein L1887_23190 [Cichorium endivia]|nr:hypothetical protein L1887_23190 [Cichorium endivia]
MYWVMLFYNSGVTISSGKEIEEKSLDNLYPTMNLQTQNVDQVKPSRTERPEVDLELSLAASFIESDVTAITKPSFSFINTSSTMTSVGVQHVDEGCNSPILVIPGTTCPLILDESNHKIDVTLT